MKGFCKNTKTCAFELFHMKHEGQTICNMHEEHTALQRTGWMGQDREQSFLSAQPDGHLRCCETSWLASVHTTGTTAISVPRETRLSLGVQVAEGGVLGGQHPASKRGRGN